MVSAFIIGTSLISDNTQPLVVRWKYLDDRKCFHLALACRCLAVVRCPRFPGAELQCKLCSVRVFTVWLLRTCSVSTQYLRSIYPGPSALQSAVTSTPITETRVTGDNEEVT